MSLSSSNQDLPPKKTQQEIDDEPDDWDQRIIDTGCDEQNMALTNCYAEKRDWRLCTQEMIAFKTCWNNNLNNERTSTVNMDASNATK
ncbi:hypothetical protein NADFUDRAFT_51427 [Nadsonia fulvescens var. elongata DSM 6958]|uniref:CHCH domain-containing protein n=1 Tax=Nadsonia fulvescens var. elongata DSM 6958 TaxID=857566 RepID=A0A1E3PMJ7_9ASCO|nr:hypothetical protein NADFUDRAFT_51427 [Nadsonia fulvescens var. elongata DSM 6958]